jgi:predicted O-methyltransferase YrrM
MRKRSLLPDAVERYLRAMNRETEVARCLREETALLPEAGMQIGPEQAALMALLVRAIGARRALEIGTFTGYSALAVAAALPLNGKLVTLDVNEAWTAIARRYWRDAGLEARIELRLGDARATLAAMLDTDSEAGAGFDFAFIDADKAGYDAYYEACLKLVRPGGLIAIDNVLWHGAVADPARVDTDTLALKALNAKIRDDARVDAALTGVADGLTLVRRRA